MTDATHVSGNPSVSIVMASYDKGPYVEAAVASALNQGRNVEVIVVDDGSTDGSRGILRAMASDEPRLRLFELKANRGGSHCRNLGIREARGEFLMFLDADDLLGPGCCEARLMHAHAEPEHDLWVFPMRVFRDRVEVTESVWLPMPGDHLAHFLAHRLDWSIMQPLWRRDFLVGLGGFDETFVRLQDPELHVRAMLAGARVRCHPEAEPDCSYRIATERHSDGSLSVAERHVNGAIHFYRSFIGRIPRAKRPLLTGTLLAAMSTISHWHRTGRLQTVAASELLDRLAKSCERPSHRALLQSYGWVELRSPVHVPGLAWSARKALGL